MGVGSYVGQPRPNFLNEFVTKILAGKKTMKQRNLMSKVQNKYAFFLF